MYSIQRYLLTLPKITSNDTTATTSNTTGSVLLSGGLGISNVTDATSATNGGTITTAGGIGIAKKLVQYPIVKLRIVNNNYNWDSLSSINQDEKQEILNLSKHGSYNNPQHKFSTSGRIFNIGIEYIDTTKDIFSITINGRDFSPIEDLPISYESKKKIFSWFKNVISNAQYKNITLNISKDGDVEHYNITWDTSTNYLNNINKYHKYRIGGKLSEYYGKWGVFDNEFIKIYDTFPSEDDQQGSEDAYIVMIGNENSPDL
jgi:hypothetical protein